MNTHSIVSLVLAAALVALVRPDAAWAQGPPDATTARPGAGATPTPSTALPVPQDENQPTNVQARYSGVAPEVHPALPVGLTPRRGGDRPTILWVGFQQHTLFSRVFVKVNQATSFSVYKPDPLHLYVDIPNARISHRNNQRELLTDKFDSHVDKIEVLRLRRRDFRGVRVVVTLDRPAGYLYKQQGDFILVDVER